MRTCSDAIETMLSKSVMLSPELLDEVESLIRKNTHLSYTAKEEFIQDAIRFRLDLLSKEQHLGARVKGRRSE